MYSGIVHYLRDYPNIDVGSSSKDDTLYLSRFFEKLNKSTTADVSSPRVPDPDNELYKAENDRNSDENNEKVDEDNINDDKSLDEKERVEEGLIK